MNAELRAVIDRALEDTTEHFGALLERAAEDDTPGAIGVLEKMDGQEIRRLLLALAYLEVERVRAAQSALVN